MDLAALSVIRLPSHSSLHPSARCNHLLKFRSAVVSTTGVLGWAEGPHYAPSANERLHAAGRHLISPGGEMIAVISLVGRLAEWGHALG
jgi:hypothetical protein